MVKEILWGVNEYTGIQRCGKNTMMVHDLVDKILPGGFSADRIWSNFHIFVPGVHWLSSEDLKLRIFEAKKSKERHLVFLYDEAGQSLPARGWTRQEQTDLVAFGWQMPKRDILYLFSDNVGNSADVVLRDCAWQTILPKFYPGKFREDDAVISTVVYNYECRLVTGIVVPHVYRIQKLFDSDEAID